MFRKGPDPGTLPFQNAGSNPNGTEKVSHAAVPQGFTSMGHDRFGWRPCENALTW
jgi:hypothetical protein